MKAIIIDDEPFARADLCDMLGELGGMDVVGEAASVDEAAELIKMAHPEIIFLDIELRGGNGFDLLSLINPDIHVIFISAHDHFALRAFEVNALDYILKPVSAGRLKESLSRVKTGGASRKAVTECRARLCMTDSILIRTESEQRMVPVAGIRALSALGGNYTTLHLKNSYPLSRTTLMKWEGRLPSSSFIRVHRSTIININYFESLNTGKTGGGKVLLKEMADGFLVSRRMLPNLIKHLPELR